MRLRHLKRVSLLGCFTLMFFISGCAQNGVSGLVRTERLPPGIPSGGNISSPSDPNGPGPGKVESVPPGDPIGAITLRQAVSLALMKNPELAAFSWEVRAGEARTLQAGLRPNPEISVESEDIGGSKERSGFDAAQTTIGLSQLIELGGKRAGRERLASLEKDLAGWDYEAKRLDVLTGVATAFTEVLGAQEQVGLTGELVRTAEQVHRTVSERVEAGKVSPLEATKAGVALSETRIEFEKAKSSLAASMKRLAATWGEMSPVFERVEGDLYAVSPVPSLEELRKRIARNPDVARWVKEMEQRTAALDLEKSKRIPDPTVSGGVRYFNDTSENAFVVGVSIPIPVFNRNQGGIREARYRLAKAKEEYRAAEVRAGASLAETYQALAFAYEQSTALRNEVLPGAEQAFAASGEGYREGKFGFLEFLDAQRTLFEARGRYIESLTQYYKSKAELERLIGEGIDAVKERGK